MARTTYGTRSELIHCENCDEDYSATYKRCPFCGARPDKSAYTQITSRFIPPMRGSSGASAPAPDSRARTAAQKEDDYVFDGQDVFDDEDADDYDDDDYETTRGGKRLADDGFGITPTTIAGILFSVVVVVAACLIVALVIVPMVRSGDTPTAFNSPNGSLPGNTSGANTSPVGDPVQSDDPDTTNDLNVQDPDGQAPNVQAPDADPAGSTAPETSPSPSTSTAPTTASGFTLTNGGRAVGDFTISDKWPAPVQLSASGATGTVTWTSSNPAAATVSANGLVTAVAKGNTTITATDSAGNTQSCKVSVTITDSAASPSPSASDSPSSPPSAAGSLTLSQTDFTISDAHPNAVTIRASGGSGTVTWSSSNTAVATVDANGKVTRVGRGTCTITATDANGVTATCTVRCTS